MASHANETFSDSSLPISSMFRIVGGWGGVSGPGMYMLRVIVVGSAAAAVLGTTFAVVGSMLTGVGTLPFVLGASIGFTGSAMSHYNSSLQQAYIALERYPGLIFLHLRANYPVWVATEERLRGPLIPRDSLYFRREDVQAEGAKIEGSVGDVGLNLRRKFESSWQMRSMLIVAWMTAGAALDEIHGRTEAYMVDRYAAMEEGREAE